MFVVARFRGLLFVWSTIILPVIGGKKLTQKRRGRSDAKVYEFEAEDLFSNNRCIAPFGLDEYVFVLDRNPHLRSDDSSRQCFFTNVFKRDKCHVFKRDKCHVFKRDKCHAATAAR